MHVEFRRPMRLGAALVSTVGLEVEQIAFVSGGLVVLEVPAESVARLGILGVRRTVPALGQRRPDGAGVWLAEDLDRLADAWNEGGGLSDLAAMFGRPVADVVAALSTLGVDVPVGE
jgi:hypothetical protein